MGTLTITEDSSAPCWESGSLSDARAQRVQAVMRLHAEAAGPSVGPMASPAHLCEVLCDLRFWCDEHVVDFHQALDQSYVRSMHGKHPALISIAR